jgi:hypothetical protein
MLRPPRQVGHLHMLAKTLRGQGFREVRGAYASRYGGCRAAAGASRRTKFSGGTPEIARAEGKGGPFSPQGVRSPEDFSPANISATLCENRSSSRFHTLVRLELATQVRRQCTDGQLVHAH